MKHVLVSATNLTGSGAVSVGLSLLPSLLQCMVHDRFTLLLPDQPAFRSLCLSENARPLFFKRRTGLSNDLDRLKELSLTVPRIAREINADLCLTLGDLIPIGLSCPSVLFLQQSLLVYDRNELAGLTGWRSWKGFGLRSYFALTVRQNAWLVVQTPVMAARVAKHYRVDRQCISVVPQPVPQHVSLETKGIVPNPLIAACDKPLKLLFLAAYYPHKNHAIVPSVAAQLRRRGMDKDVQFFLTINKRDSAATDLLESLAPYSDMVTNLGNLTRHEVPGALRASTALFMPTLVESYGLIYVEAMACGLPILTSDRDFARWMCEEMALYFDPLDGISVVDAISRLPAFDVNGYREAASRRLLRFPKDWREEAAMFADVLNRARP